MSLAQPPANPEESEPAQSNHSPRLLGEVDSLTSQHANRRWWDDEAGQYHAEHGDFLGTDLPGGDFIWCPEGLREADARLLGDVAGKNVLEVGAGSAPCSRWLATQGAHVVATDLSHGMLAYGLAEMTRRDTRTIPLVQATAESLPFASESFDVAFSSFGAVPFVADSAQVMREAARVLRPGGRWVFSINHPMRWMFPDDPGPAGLTVAIPYFNRTPYSEADSAGTLTYVEHHRTIGDRVREIRASGLILDDIVEPEWPDDLEREWGQWSPLRGHYFPGTAIFCTTVPAA